METKTSEQIFSYAYEHALCSAYRHGVTLTDFRFDLPQADDILTFENGNRALRSETHTSGYSDDEIKIHEQLLRVANVQTPFMASLASNNLPASFLDDTDMIFEMHHRDLVEIAQGLVRDMRKNTMADTLIGHYTALTDASLIFHHALLHATDALFHIDQSSIAQKLMHVLFPQLLEEQENLLLAVRRLEHNSLIYVLEKGMHDQIFTFLTAGHQRKIEGDFFQFHLNIL